jgi:ribonuclease P protein component
VENSKPVGLKRSADFLLIKNKGKRKVLSPWLLLAFRPNEQGHLRFGCTITRKVGPAVTRNRLKRWTREYFRKMAAHGFNPEFDINLVFRPMSAGFYKELSYSQFVEVLDQSSKILR